MGVECFFFRWFYSHTMHCVVPISPSYKTRHKLKCRFKSYTQSLDQNQMFKPLWRALSVLDNIESDVHVIFIENYVFTVFSGIIQNPVVPVRYYHMPFSVMMKHKWRQQYTVKASSEILKLLQLSMFLSVQLDDQWVSESPPKWWLHTLFIM